MQLHANISMQLITNMKSRADLSFLLPYLNRRTTQGHELSYKLPTDRQVTIYLNSKMLYSEGDAVTTNQ